jgi:hypothetical protein
MTTIPNVVNSANASQMSTPIKNLPLKTTQQNENDIEDPLIQGVLKEFEDTVMANTQPPQQPPQQQSQPPPQPVEYTPPPPVFSPPPVMPEPVNMNHLDYNSKGSDKKLFDLETLKRATIVTIILVLFQNNSILNIGLSRLPSSVTNHITGREIIMNSFIVFVIVYTLMYFDFI